MKLRNVLVVHKIGFTDKEKKAYNTILEILKKKGIFFRVISLLEVHASVLHDRDLVIVIGGDGTFLKTTHAATAVPFLCINANPEKTEGFFSRTTATTAEKKLAKIRAGKIKPKTLWRLQAAINGRLIEPCMNEYYIGEQKPYHVSRYVFQCDGICEIQKSSGLLVCTAAGSSAWCRSAGGKVLALDKKEFQAVVREPYIGRLAKTKIKKKIFKNAVVSITALSEGIVVVADAVGKEHSVPRNSTVVIKQSEKPLLLFY